VNIALAPNAVRVLQHIGVLHELRDLGYNYEQLAVTNAHGQQLGLMYNGSAKEYNFKALRIHRSEVHKALLRECKAQGVKVRFGMRLTKLEEGDDEVKLEFANGQVEYAEFVVGADGVYSSVRPFVVDCELTYSGFMGIIGMRIVRERLHESINGVHFPNFFFGKTGFVAMMPSDYHGKELDFFSTMPYRSHKRQEWEDLNKNKGELHRIINERFGSRWPEFIGQICREYNPKDLSQHPYVHSSSFSSSPPH
jgi:2-polyprenyl-6-methoxyphenol hydroxylase-like FAD-dependent oxidoreductase